ncbi:MAG: HDOD domain-containing protein [Pontibacterium sp.]
MSEQTPLYGLDSWVKYLGSYDIPVRSSVQRKLLKLLSSPATNTATVITFVKQDPTLAFHVVKKAQAFHNDKQSQVTGIEHAVNSLGFDHLTRLVRELPIIKVSPQALSHRLFFRACSNSLVASELTRHWLQHKHSLFIEDGQLASLFYSAHEWLMWLYAPVHMADIYKQVHTQGQTNEVAEMKVLGCQLKDIALALQKQWQMPNVVQEAIAQQGALKEVSFNKMFRWVQSTTPISDEDSRQFGLAQQDKGFAVALANQLANSLRSGAYFQLQNDLIELVAFYLKNDPEDCYHAFTQQLLIASRRFSVAGALSPMAEFLFIPLPVGSNLAFDYSITQQELTRLLPNYPAPGYQSTEIAQPAAKASKGDGKQAKRLLDQLNNDEALKNKQLLEKIMTALQHQGSQLSSKQVLQYLVKGLNEGLGADRVIVHKAQSQQLKHVLSYGLEENDRVRSYATKLDQGGLFGKLTKQSGVVWVNADNHSSMLRIIPKNYHPFMGQQGNLFVSLDLGEGKFALIHLYRSNALLSTQDHKTCLLLFNHARKALSPSQGAA